MTENFLEKKTVSKFDIKLDRTMFMVFVIGIIGVFIRIYQYFQFRSLWLDEAVLALNIINKPINQLLFSPLDYNQGAPLLFLFIEKNMTIFFGNSEASLRFFPLLAGIGSLFLIVLLSYELVGKTGALISVLFIAFNPTLIYYSSEVKQYSSDAAFSILILYIYVLFLKKPPTLKRLIFFLAFGFLAALISHPSIFILGALCIERYISLFRAKKYSELKNWVFISIIWLTFYIAYYFISLKYISANQNLISFWNNAFFPFPPWKNIGWFPIAIAELLHPFETLINELIPVFLVLGLFFLLKNHSNIVIVPIFIFLLTLIASGMQKYPFQGRFLLFLFPIMLIFFSSGVAYMYEKLKVKNKIFASSIFLFVILIFFYNPFYETIKNLINPIAIEETKTLLKTFIENRENQDPLYVYYATEPAFIYYANIYDIDMNNIYFSSYHGFEPDKYIDYLDQFKKDSRVWFLFSHVCRPSMLMCEVDEMDYILAYLNEIGTISKEFTVKGAWLYLFEFNK